MASMVLALLCSPAPAFGASAAQTEGNHQSTIQWPKKQALPTFARAEHLDVANVHDAPGDVKLLMTTLQGIVNREKPRIYLVQNENDPWFEDMTIPHTFYDNYMDIFAKYKKEIKGVIVYDPLVPDSINVATTLAGLKDAVVVSPEWAATLTSAPYGLKIVEDLRGKFQNKMDAYTWQYENLWSRTTHRMLIGLSPNTSIPIPPGIPDTFDTIAQETRQIRDASNRGVYEYDLSPYLGQEAVYVRLDDAFPQDGWGPAVHAITVTADGQTIAQFDTNTPEEEAYLYDRQGSKALPGADHRFADNGNYFVYEFKPPAGAKQLTISIEMWNQFKVSVGNVRPLSSEEKEPFGYLRDYAVANKAMVFWLSTDVPEQRALFEQILADVEPGTPYLGWFSNDFEGEAASVDLLSAHSVFTLAADWFHNMTVLSGTRPVNVPERKPAKPKLQNKIYVTFTFGEGDNLQYDENHMREVLWEDPARGKVPINWTSSPLLYDAAPSILNYYRQTATENDLLVAGPSGAGYFSPHPWPETTFPDFLKSGYRYLKDTGMTIPMVINREVTQDVPLSEDEAAAYGKDYKVPGILLAGNKFGIDIVGGVPVSNQRGIGTVQDGKDVLAEAKAGWDGQSPLFLSVGVNAWGMRPSDVLAIAESLGPEYEVVTADTYFALVRKAYGLSK
ncbi:GxGYxYP domain-containing protein [Cohnella thermotolerans]|uniref:GxGYxYP domain-containing protein n=1 Tax=Cohnella thermotolerans TaxID=329858 RepID=UPI001F0B7000|nr:GxGYxYP domain-containing protein [Cohnella thermotolerans]